MSVAFDTNFLVRHLTADDRDQYAVVRRVETKAADRGATILLPSVVLCETVWVLESVYRFDRLTVAMAYEALMADTLFVYENPTLIREGLNRYRVGRGDFADYIIQGSAALFGFTQLATFDKALKDERGFEVY